MKTFFGYLLYVAATFLYIVGLWVLAQEVHYSVKALIATLSNPALATAFITVGVGALAPGAILHYFGRRLLKSPKNLQGQVDDDL